MTDTERLERRLDAVERALTDGDAEVAALATAEDLVDRVDRLAARVETLEREAAEREAAVRAVRGYVGQERSLDREVERTAESALASVESLQERVRRVEDRLDEGERASAGPGDRDATDTTAGAETTEPGSHGGEGPLGTGAPASTTVVDSDATAGATRQPRSRRESDDAGPLGRLRSLLS